MSISDKFTDMIGSFLNFVPQLVGAIVVLLVGYVVAKIVQSGLRRALQVSDVDQRLRSSDIGNMIERATSAPSRSISRVTYWAIMLATIALAASVLNIPALTAFIAGIVAYIPSIIAALAILAVAGVFSAMFAAAIGRTLGETATGKIASTAVPAITMTIATFMALNQLGIARDIVNITFGALMGAVALGLALAFGLGGRKVAEQMLDEAYVAGQKQAAQVRVDLAEARERATVKSPQYHAEPEAAVETEPEFETESETVPNWTAQPGFAERIGHEDDK